MLKTLALILAVSTTTAAAYSPAAAQSWVSINQRQQMLEQRIDAGMRTGQLTASEAAGLRAQYRDIANLEMGYRSGGLSAAERRDLDRRFDRLSASIRAERHDPQVAGGWFGGNGWMDQHGVWTPINARQRELDRRIDTGVASGRLTANEARNLRREYRSIARLEARYRRHGLNMAERRDLDLRFDRLAAHIRWEANDWQVRPEHRR
jgi:hypothetical protein